MYLGFIVLLWFALCGGIAAQPLRLVADSWPPFTDQRLLNNGFATDLVSTALRRAGYTVEYAQVPWARATRGLQTADYDIVIAAWYSPERARYGQFSNPYLINRVRFIQRRGGVLSFNELADLHGYRIAAVRGYEYSPEFDRDTLLQKVEVPGFVVGARMVHARRLDLAVEDEYVARYHLARELLDIRDELVFLPLPLSENPLHILVRRSHPQHAEIIAAFNRAVDQMNADGTYAALFKRHGL
ncbi:MAG: transporter substrate-binding domain-containing protein [Pseudomonas sp.]|uniref:substrate-binding periplasmic protein n=1 Tax=Pseudomonas sp. TaxID=306 RepID=UPI003392EFF1